jgi:hypothetical protein
MKYYRIHTSDIAYLTQQPRGIFIAVWRLSDAKLLTDEEEEEYQRNYKYFEEVLPVPPYYKQGNPDKAVTWFKDTDEGNRIWNEMTFYRKIAAKYGLKLYISETDEIPGDIVYEDDFQIAVKNQFQNAKILTKEITQNI